MKKSFIVLLLAAAVMTSCKKSSDVVPNPGGNNNPTNPVAGMKLVKKSDIWSGDINFEYNADSTLKKLYYTQGNYDLASNFTYQAGRIIRVGTSNGVMTERDTMFLENGKGKLLIRSFFSNGNQQPYSKDTTTYEYTNGLISKVNYQSGDYTLYTYESNGDLKERVTYNAQGQVKYKYEYAYYPQIEKNPYYNQMQGNYFARYLSPISKHVVKYYKNTDYTIPSTNEYWLNHEYDNDGYVIKSTWWNMVNPGVVYTSLTTYY